jgi:oligoendopeptidase F
MEIMSKELNEKLGTAEVQWNLQDLYESREDPQIGDDLYFCEEEATLLKEIFAGKLDTLEPAVLARTVRRLERVSYNLGRVATFAFLDYATQVKDDKATAFLQEITEAASRIGRETVFFDLEWSKMDQDKADTLLSAEEIGDFHHYLATIRRYADHMLSQAEETLLIELGPVGSSSWTSLFGKVMAHIKFGEQGRTEEEVLSDMYHADREVRRLAAQELTDGLQSQLHILTHIFNTLLADKMINDRLRSYPSWVTSRNLSNEIEGETVDALVHAVTGRYDMVQRYYRVKKSLLKVDELYDYDRYAPLENLPDVLVPWDECKTMVLDGFRKFSPKMAEIAALFFDRKWIHAPIMEGKSSGAFAHPGVPDVHPYVLVNYTGNIRDVSTVAHELGHGVHQYLASGRGYYNSDTPLVLAETASVFAELLIFHNQLESLADPAERKAFICQKLESIFATVFRQVSMNRFEDMMHTGRREEGELSSDRLSEMWQKSQEDMFGDSVTLTDNYGMWWSYIPHFLHSPGYVYSYAFGELLVLALYSLYKKEGASFVSKYTHLLSQGGSLSPYVLLEPFGIDLNDPQFWQGGLDIIDEMLQEVEEG